MAQAVSTPDNRLYKSGTPDQIPSRMMVSVVEVNNDPYYSTSKFKRRTRKICPSKHCPFMTSYSFLDFKHTKKRIECSSKHCPYSSSSEAENVNKGMENLSINPSSSTDSLSEAIHKDKGSNKSKTGGADIMIHFSKQILGQHAGELLFDLHRYCKDKELVIHRMPGLLVDGTKVYFTLLKMANEHYKKIKQNHKLDDEDEAVIYYTVSFDILNEESRNILIQNFMRLNNLRKCSCQEDKSPEKDSASSQI